MLAPGTDDELPDARNTDGAEHPLGFPSMRTHRDAGGVGLEKLRGLVVQMRASVSVFTRTLTLAQYVAR